MKHTHRIFGLIAASLLSSAVIYGQSARVIYEQDDNFPFATTEFRSPWNGGDVGNNNFMPDPTGRIFSRNEVFGTTAVIRVRLQDFTGGDSFGRLALVAGNGFWTQGSSEYNLPTTAPTAWDLAGRRARCCLALGSVRGISSACVRRQTVRFSQALPRHAPMWSCATRRW